MIIGCTLPLGTGTDKVAVCIAQGNPRLLRLFQQVTLWGRRTFDGGLISLVELLSAAWYCCALQVFSSSWVVALSHSSASALALSSSAAPAIINRFIHSPIK